MENKKNYYLTHLTSDLDGQYVFLEMLDEYLDDEDILNISYKYLDKCMISNEDRLKAKFISHIGSDN